jgi:hypothetical protein
MAIHAAKEGSKLAAKLKRTTSDSTAVGNEDPEVPRAAYSISEFCKAHRICEAFYYKLRAAGLGPREMRTLRKVTISIEAAGEWRRARENAAE